VFTLLSCKPLSGRNTDKEYSYLHLFKWSATKLLAASSHKFSVTVDLSCPVKPPCNACADVSWSSAISRFLSWDLKKKKKINIELMNIFVFHLQQERSYIQSCLLGIRNEEVINYTWNRIYLSKVFYLLPTLATSSILQDIYFLSAL